MRLFPVVVKRVAAAVAGALTNQVVVRPARRVSIVVAFVDQTTLRLGRRLSLAPVSLMTLLKPARRLTTFASGSTNAEVRAARRLSTLATGTPAAAVVEPARKLSYVISNVYRRGGSSHVNTGTAWTNPANVVSGTAGKHDGQLATRAGQIGAATNGTLELSYPAATDRGGQVIASAQLEFFVRQTGTALNNGGLELSYSVNGGGSWTVLETITGNVDSLAAPRVFDITAAVAGDWAKVGAQLKTRVRANLAIGTAAVSVAADAVEIVAATETMEWVP